MSCMVVKFCTSKVLESENLEFQNSSYERSMHAQLPRMVN